jgi:tetratricopeptide (TPR) repeat protein
MIQLLKAALGQARARAELALSGALRNFFPVAVAGATLFLFVPPARSIPTGSDFTSPESAREAYNTGTRQLRAGKLREAEVSLEAALASQQERLQPPTLYNLGLVRFSQGLEQLKKAPDAKPMLDRSRAAYENGDAALRQVQDALESNDLQKMVEAYRRGRGARKELRSATDAVQRAFKMHGAVLARWERALGDFKGALELKQSDADARHNADVVDRCIAKLVDSLREMQQCSSSMGNKKQQLGEALKKLKGRIPGQDMPPGAPGDDDDDEDEPPPGPQQQGTQEAASKEGQEKQELSPDQASWLLEGYKLDADRRLPMGQGNPTPPRDRSRPTW